MTEGGREGRREVYYYEELVHVMTEAEKSYDRICKLETQDSWWCSSSPSVKAREPIIQVLVLEQKEPKVPVHSLARRELFLPWPLHSI